VTVLQQFEEAFRNLRDAVTGLNRVNQRYVEMKSALNDIIDACDDNPGILPPNDPLLLAACKAVGREPPEQRPAAMQRHSRDGLQTKEGHFCHR
jgi:hypothetical protein